VASGAFRDAEAVKRQVLAAEEEPDHD
jgi:hypothetical protein